MSSATFTARRATGMITMVSSAAALSALIVLGNFDAAPRAWLLIAGTFGSICFVWHLSRVGQFTLTRVDTFVWAVLLSHTVIVARMRDPRLLGEEQSLTSEIAVEISIWILCLGYSAWRLLRTPQRLRVLWGPGARHVTMLCIAALASATYAASPSITLAWTIKLFAIILGACLLFDPLDRRASCERFLEGTFTGLVLMLVLFLVLGALSPSAAIEQSDVTGIIRVGGFLLPATQLAAVSGMAGMLALIDILSGSRRRWRRAILPGCLGLMLVSLGRGGMLAAALCALLVLAAFRKTRLLVPIVVLGGIVLLAVPGLAAFAWDVLSRRQDVDQISSLTGRLPLWEKAIELIWQKPLLGWGYVSGSRVALMIAFRWWPAPHSHNAFLEMLLGLGLAGASILLAMLWKTLGGAILVLRRCWTAIAPSPSALAALKVATLVLFLVVDGMFSAGFSGTPRFEAVILIGSVFCVDQLRLSLRPGGETPDGAGKVAP